MLARLRPHARAGCSSTSASRSPSRSRPSRFTGVLAVVVPKGFFPQQDTGLIVGVTRGAARRLVREHDGAPAGRRRGRAGGSRRRHGGVVHRRRRHEPDREQRAPLDRAEAARPSATASAAEIIARLQTRSSATVEGIALYLQAGAGPADRDRASAARSTSTRSRTPTPTSSRRGRRGSSRGCRRCPSSRDVASDQQTRRAAAHARHRPRHRRRASASTPQAIDDTLYDAFGQRQVSTIFTQLNQYRVILEVKPEFQQDPDALAHIYVRSASRRPGPALGLHALRARHRAARDQPPGAVPRGDALVQPRARRRRSATPSTPSTRAEREIGLPPGVHAEFAGHGAGLPRVARERAAPHPRGAPHRLHRAGRALRELHPPGHDPLDAALGRRGRAARAHARAAPSSASSRSSGSSCSSAS